MDEYQSIIKVVKDALASSDVSYKDLCLELIKEHLEMIVSQHKKD
jgi:hypothetical protein